MDATSFFISLLERGALAGRIFAASVLAEFDSSAVAGPLASAALEDQAAAVRIAAQWALERHGLLQRGRRWAAELVSPEELDALADALCSETLAERLDAAFALAEIGDTRALSFLTEEALQAKDREFRILALRALGRLRHLHTVTPCMEALQDADAEVRRAAAKALGRLKSSIAVPPLIAALGDSNELVRAAAADSLQASLDRRCIPALVDRFTRDSAAVVRRACGNALLELDAVVEPSACRAALADPEPRVRFFGSNLLGRVSGSTATEEGLVLAALTLALKDPDPSVRQQAAHSLAHRGAEHARSLLTTLLDDSDLHVRVEVVNALGRVIDPDTGGQTAVARQLVNLALHAETEMERIAAGIALGQLADPPIICALIDALGHQKAEVRQSAAWALKEIGDPKALSALAEKYTDANADVRRAVMWALADRRAPEALTVALALIDDPDSSVQAHAAWALGLVGSLETAFQPLMRVLTHEDANVVAKAATALGLLGDPRAADALIALLSEDVSQVRRSALTALGGVGLMDDRRISEALQRHLHDRDAEVRRAALTSLAEVSPASPEAVIEILLYDPEAKVRRQAARTLAKIDTQRAVAALILGLRDTDARTRKAAAFALAAHKDVRASQALVVALRDPEPEVRRAAALTLGELRSVTACGALCLLLFDGHPLVRRAAALALGKCGDDSAVPALASAAMDENDEARQAVAQALTTIEARRNR